MNHPVSPQLVQQLSSRWRDVKAAYAALPRSQRLALDNRIRMQRMASSTTLVGGRGRAVAETSRENFTRADALVARFIAAGRALSVEALQELHATIEPGRDGGLIRGAGVNLRTNCLNHLKCYLPGNAVQEELAALVRWYHDAKVAGTHPLVLAAQVYQRGLSIHPFKSGANGRTFRLALDWILQEHGFPPATFGSDSSSIAVFGTLPARGQWTPTGAVLLVTRAVERTMAELQQASAVR